jgi:hypothetical protein
MIMWVQFTILLKQIFKVAETASPSPATPTVLLVVALFSREAVSLVMALKYIEG